LGPGASSSAERSRGRFRLRAFLSLSSPSSAALTCRKGRHGVTPLESPLAAAAVAATTASPRAASAAAASCGTSGSIFAQKAGSSMSTDVPDSDTKDACANEEEAPPPPPPPEAPPPPCPCPPSAVGRAPSSPPTVRVVAYWSRICSIDDSPYAFACASCSSLSSSCAPVRSSRSICVARCRTVDSSSFSDFAKPVAVIGLASYPEPAERITACSRPSLWLAVLSMCIS